MQCQSCGNESKSTTCNSCYQKQVRERAARIQEDNDRAKGKLARWAK